MLQDDIRLLLERFVILLQQVGNWQVTPHLARPDRHRTHIRHPNLGRVVEGIPFDSLPRLKRLLRTNPTELCNLIVEFPSIVPLARILQLKEKDLCVEWLASAFEFILLVELPDALW